VALQRSPQPTHAPSSPVPSPSPAGTDRVETSQPRWLRLALVLAAAGAGLILLGAWGLLWRRGRL
jgi:hypothetical protein